MERAKAKVEGVVQRIFLGGRPVKLFMLVMITFAVVFLTSCERTIDFDLNEQPARLVVEASIENGQPPVVYLSKSLNYFSNITPGILSASFVHDAVVTLSNGTRTHKLKEYYRPLGAGLNFFYYSIDSSDLATAFVGELNRQYTLDIKWSGGSHSATTTIPEITRRIDSLWAEKSRTDSSRVIVKVRATDRPGYGDYIRYYSNINGQGFLPGYSVYDDLFIDGTTYELQVEPGVDRNREITDDDRYFKRGDSVVFKISNIDKSTYDFWRTMEYSYGAVGNPFSTPTRVLGNISNGALGYFGGYASQFRTIVIPQ